MVTGRRLDPVSARLREAGSGHSASAMEWMQSQQQRQTMRRRAKACVFGGWMLMLTAALISTAVSMYLANQIQAIVAGELETAIPSVIAYNYVPAVLLMVTGIVLIGGIVCWWTQRVPGLSRTASALEWSAAGDAVTRLIRAGCTFPEAFRAAADVAMTRRVHRWLMDAARRVESGGPELAEHSLSYGDTAVIETLVGATESAPDVRWKVAADHFFNVAQRRLALLLQTTPMIATILSGLIVWLAISTSLGWMWRAVAQLLQSMGGGF